MLGHTSLSSKCEPTCWQFNTCLHFIPRDPEGMSCFHTRKHGRENMGYVFPWLTAASPRNTRDRDPGHLRLTIDLLPLSSLFDSFVLQDRQSSPGYFATACRLPETCSSHSLAIFHLLCCCVSYQHVVLSTTASQQLWPPLRQPWN